MATLEERVEELERRDRVHLLLIATVAHLAIPKHVRPRVPGKTKALAEALQAYVDDPSNENLDAALDAATFLAEASDS